MSKTSGIPCVARIGRKWGGWNENNETKRMVPVRQRAPRHLFTRNHPPVALVKLPPACSHMLPPGDPESQPHTHLYM